MPTPCDVPFDWSRIARLIVHDSLRTEPGERVVLHVDPTYLPELTEQVRIELTRAGAVEVGAMLQSSPGLAAVRRRLRRREDPAWRQREDEAMRGVFALADIFIWLPTSWAYNYMQTEEIVAGWPGRSIHFHWVLDIPPSPTYPDPVAFRALSEQYQRALLIDYAALTAHQQALAGALRGQAVHITDTRGTDLRFTVPAGAHFIYGNGDASRAFIGSQARPHSAREKEVELPCGSLRTVAVDDPTGVLVVPDHSFGGRYVGTARYEFRDGRLARIETEHHARWVTAMWELETGDRDRLGELNIGCNPELRPLAGVDEMPYFGYGAGVLRLDLGDNAESGGPYRSSFHGWTYLTDATMTAGTRTLIDAGELRAV